MVTLFIPLFLVEPAMVIVVAVGKEDEAAGQVGEEIAREVCRGFS